MAASSSESPAPIRTNGTAKKPVHADSSRKWNLQTNGSQNHGDRTTTTTTTSTTTTMQPSDNYYYLTAEAAAAIPRYQYHGEDRSLMYKYLLSPLAQYLVDHWTPVTLAPNSITLLGLVLMAAAYGFVWYHAPHLVVEDDDVRWIFLYNCCAMLIYQTLDNMDGKQARRTRSSSPLGLLFDHGCDAVNSIFGSANWIVAMGLNPGDDALLCWILVVGPYALFYIATWEEYYTGELILPIANGPNEGLFGGAMLSLTSYLYGPAFWQGYAGFDSWILPILSSFVSLETAESMRMRNSTLVGIVSVLGMSQEVILKSIHVSRTYGSKTLLDGAPFFAVSASTLVVGYCDPTIWTDLPRTGLHLYACLIVEMVTELMRAHICHQPFRPLRRWINLPLLVLTVVVVAGSLTGRGSPGWTREYVLVYTTAACTYLTLKLTIVVDEICRVLNIWCFDIVTPRRQACCNGHKSD